MVVSAIDADEFGVEVRMMIKNGSVLAYLYSIQAGEIFRLNSSYPLSKPAMMLFREWPP